MKLKTKVPGRVVQKRIKRQGKWRVVPWFRFDEHGFAEIDETKVTKSDLIKLTRLFEVVKDDLSPLKEEPRPITPDLSKMSYKDLQKLYTDKTGKTAVGIKKDEIIQALEVL